MLKIAVLIKQIPLIEDANFDRATKTMRRDGPNVVSAFDLRAVALAVELKQRAGAEITVATMGPPQAREALEQVLAMGTDRAVLISDRVLAGSDTLATARALAAWLRRDRFDLVLLGKYSLDSETGQVGPEVADLIGAAQVTGARKLELDGRVIRAERESDEGYEEIEAPMPVVVTCAERVAQPIRIKPGALEQAKSKPLEILSAGDLTVGPAQVGLAGSATWVADIMVSEPIKTQCIMIEPSDPERAAAAVVEHLDRLGALTRRARSRRLISSVRHSSRPGRDIWIAVETNMAGFVSRATLELLSRGDELVQHLGGALIAVGFGLSTARHAGILASYGADRVIAIDSPQLASYTPEAAAQAMASLITDRRPWGLFLPASERGRDWGPRMAARLELGLTGDAIGLEIDAQERLVALKPAFGGNIVASILCKTLPQMATVRSGVLALAEPNSSRNAELETAHLRVSAPISRLIAEHSLLDAGFEPLEGAEIVVGIGTGVGGEDGVAALKDFACVLGGAICATRRVTDLGRIARQLQVGLTGKTIDPRLYFAVGIRGAFNHTVGIKRAETVVAINSDPEAPIFERATLGLVGDWSTIIPALRDALQNRLA